MLVILLIGAEEKGDQELSYYVSISLLFKQDHATSTKKTKYHETIQLRFHVICRINKDDILLTKHMFCLCSEGFS